MVDPLSVKHTVANQAAVERTHPTFFPLSEQWETSTQAIQQLHCGQAFIRLPNDTVRRVATPTLPRITVSTTQPAAVRQHYRQRYFRPLPQPHQAGPQLVASAAPAPAPGTATTAKSESHLEQLISRHHPDEPNGQPRSAGLPQPVVWRRPGGGRRR